MFIYIMRIYYIYLYKYVVFEQLKPKKKRINCSKIPGDQLV